MINTAALAATMTTLANAIQSIPAVAVTPKAYNPFVSNDPFNIFQIWIHRL